MSCRRECAHWVSKDPAGKIEGRIIWMRMLHDRRSRLSSEGRSGDGDKKMQGILGGETFLNRAFGLVI